MQFHGISPRRMYVVPRLGPCTLMEYGPACGWELSFVVRFASAKL